MKRVKVFFACLLVIAVAGVGCSSRSRSPQVDVSASVHVALDWQLSNFVMPLDAFSMSAQERSVVWAARNVAYVLCVTGSSVVTQSLTDLQATYEQMAIDAHEAELVAMRQEVDKRLAKAHEALREAGLG